MNKEITTFVEFWQAIKQIQCAEDEILLFRGHPDKKYLLLPGAFRDKAKNAEMNQYHDIMIEYPEEFQQRSHLSNLVKMQHYGVATRLLDFSRNPLVALFFASELSSRGAMDIRNEADGEVVIVRIKKSEILHHNSDRALMLSCLPCFSDADQKKLKEFCDSHRGRISEQYVQAYDSAIHRLLHEIRGEYPGFACEMIGEDLLNGFFVAPFKDNERMKLQNGLFYIFGLNREELDHRLDVIRIVVNKNAKKEILHDLKLMNISNSHLYSGFERAAMNIRNKRAEWSEIS